MHRVSTIVLCLVSICTATITDDIRREAGKTSDLESKAAIMLDSIDEQTRVTYGALPYTAYFDNKTSFKIVRADDKVFVEHQTMGRFFMKTNDFWSRSVNSDAVFALSEHCQFPPTVAKRQARCPPGMATCAEKEEADCDKHADLMANFVQNGYLTKDMFDCLTSHLTKKSPSLSYICAFNAARVALNHHKSNESTAPKTIRTSTRRSRLG